MFKKYTFGTVTFILVLSLYACSDPTGNDNTPSGPVMFTVTFDPNGGTIDGNTAVKTIEVAPDGTVPELPVPVNNGFYFWGWFTDNGIWGNRFDTETPVTWNITVYAQWETTELSKELTIVFVGNGGHPTSTIVKVMTGECVDPLPVVTRNNHEFVEWNTLQSGEGDTFTKSTPVYETMSVYAQWKDRVSTGVNSKVYTGR